MTMLQKYKQTLTPPYTKKDFLPLALTLLLIVGLIGIIFIANQQTNLRSKAAGITTANATAQEAEDFTPSGNVTVGNDTNASGGKYIQLGTAATGVTPPPTGGLNLPRIPWEGGPSYYQQFSKAAAAGWTNPNFFPIAAWYMRTNNQSDADIYKAAGISTAINLETSGQPSVLRANGMFAVPSDPRPDLGSESMGWLLDDEVDMTSGPGAGYTVMQSRVNALPSNDGKPKYANYGKGVMFWETDDEAQQFVNNYTQFVSNDIYWYTDGDVCGGIQGPALIPGSGPVNPYANKPDLTPAECRRASNYGVTMDRMRYFDGMDGKRQPIFNFIEIGYPFNNGLSITGDQIAGAVINSLIHEARGIHYFKHSFSGPCQSTDILIDCPGTPKAKITETNNRIQALAPVLNTQSYQYTFNPNVQTMLKEQGGSYYIFAMPGPKLGGAYTGSQTFQLPTGLNGATIEVMFENRTLPINASRQFTDSFAAEYSYHIYKITP